MRWEDIRKHYPQTWLLIEALQARSEGGRRILDDLAVLGSYRDSAAALEGYTGFHHAEPGRELYVFHTSREHPDVIERSWLGIRARLDRMELRPAR